jgi:hypothetical protein
MAAMPSTPSAPTPALMLALPVLAAAVGAATFGLTLSSGAAARTAAIGAGISAVLVGWPTVFLLLDSGRTGLAAFSIAGALMGVAPLAAGLASGMLGLFLRSGEIAAVTQPLRYGAPIPWYGLIVWPTFWKLAGLAVSAGLTTGVLHWAVFVRRQRAALR